MSDGNCYPLAGKRVYVAGHGGMVGQALVRRLREERCSVLTAPRSELDLTDQSAVNAWMSQHKPDALFIAAAKVGGILANSEQPANFLYINLMIVANLIEAAHRQNLEKLVFLGSSCIYPKYSAQPIREDALLNGSLEPTNESYAIAKIAGLKLCQAYRRQFNRDFVAAMPTNLYGPGDNYNATSSHVIPALIRRFHDAKLSRADRVSLWGTGRPRREFLHVDDCADALVMIMTGYTAEQHINVGSGTDLSINELASLIAKIVGYEGEIEHDLTKPDGTPRKLMCSAKLRALGWRPSIALEDGLRSTYQSFLETEQFLG